jgi:hypothetical protein
MLLSINTNQELNLQLHDLQRRPNRFLKPVRSNLKKIRVSFQSLIRIINKKIRTMGVKFNYTTILFLFQK